MKLWTVQPIEVLDILEKDHVYICDESKSYNLSKKDSLRKPYQWLIKQMEEKIGERPNGVIYPIWSWHTWDYERRCPDTNSAAFLERSSKKVLLTLDIPEDEVVLTDFDAWQNVLQNTYLTNEIDEDKLDKIADYLDSLDGDDLQCAIEDSWKNVFDIREIHDKDMQRGRYIQATFWKLVPEYIQDIQILDENA